MKVSTNYYILRHELYNYYYDHHERRYCVLRVVATIHSAE